MICLCAQLSFEEKKKVQKRKERRLENRFCESEVIELGSETKRRKSKL